MPDTAERGNRIMAIFHFTVKIVGRSKGKSVISASAYLNGDVMKNEETGRISYYTSKKEVVYTSLMMCENAPPEWLHVPEENIKRVQQSIRYKRADDKEAALEKFKITFQKQRLWNEVLKIEKNADAQLGRSFEFSLPKEWSRQEQIDYTTEYIQKTFVDNGNLFRGLGKDSIADQSAISLIICATGICWNQVVCKRMAGSQRISLKQKYRYFIGTICIYFRTNKYYHISMKGECV